MQCNLNMIIYIVINTNLIKSFSCVYPRELYIKEKVKTGDLCFNIKVLLHQVYISHEISLIAIVTLIIVIIYSKIIKYIVY